MVKHVVLIRLRIIGTDQSVSTNRAGERDRSHEETYLSAWQMFILYVVYLFMIVQIS